MRCPHCPWSIQAELLRRRDRSALAALRPRAAAAAPGRARPRARPQPRSRLVPRDRASRSGGRRARDAVGDARRRGDALGRASSNDARLHRRGDALGRSHRSPASGRRSDSPTTRTRSAPPRRAIPSRSIAAVAVRPGLASATAWEAEAEAAEVALDVWLVLAIDRAPARFVAWEAAAADEGRSLPEWALVHAARRCRSTRYAGPDRRVATSPPERGDQRVRVASGEQRVLPQRPEAGHTSIERVDTRSRGRVSPRAGIPDADRLPTASSADGQQRLRHALEELRAGREAGGVLGDEHRPEQADAVGEGLQPCSLCASTASRYAISSSRSAASDFRPRTRNSTRRTPVAA